MARQDRFTGPAVNAKIEHLAQHIHRADFVAAIRLLESLAPDRPKLGRASRLRDESVRLSQNPTLAFRNSSLENLVADDGPHAYRLYCNFMGMFGNNGPLPLHLTEHALHRAEHERDPTFREFVDLFNHRMLSLFYLAIAESDPVINMDSAADNRYMEFVSSLCGVLPDAASQRDSLPDVTRFKYAAWLGARTNSPEGLENILGECFGLPCEVEEFVGGWLPMPQQAQIKLGSKELNCELGKSTFAGRRVWSVGHKIRINLGPMTWEEYNQFAPGGDWNLTLRDMTRTYLGDETDWDIKLTLAAGEVRRLQLKGGMRMGFNSWLFGSSDRSTLVSSSIKNRSQVTGTTDAFGRH